MLIFCCPEHWLPFPVCPSAPHADLYPYPWQPVDFCVRVCLLACKQRPCTVQLKSLCLVASGQRQNLVDLDVIEYTSRGYHVGGWNGPPVPSLGS